MFKKILNLVFRRDSGSFSLGYGKHNGIIIKLKKTPKEFWINTNEKALSGCGQNTLSAFGYRIIKNGILFYSNIKTQKCIINWKVKY